MLFEGKCNKKPLINNIPGKQIRATASTNTIMHAIPAILEVKTKTPRA